jgi:AcrR family transcriptional regulator
MPTTKTTKKKTADAKAKVSKTTILNEYKTYVLTHNKEPGSVYLFAQALGISESEFYEYYSSFEAIKASVWEQFIDDTIAGIKKDQPYQEYTNRERLLAFYYTLIERLKHDRSFVKYTIEGKFKRPELHPAFLKHFKIQFLEYAETLIADAYADKEIIKRPILSKGYKDGMWLQLIFIIGFWLKDDSEAFEQTDAAVEKSVNLSFELMGHGPIDLMIDFGKFLYQNK